MTDIMISQTRPAIIDENQVKWKRPITGLTLSQMAHAANCLQAARGFAHVAKSWTYERDGAGDTVDNIFLKSPESEAFTYHIIIPEINPLAAGVALAFTYQGFNSLTNDPEAEITMTKLSDGSDVDSPSGGHGILLSRANLGIPVGGIAEDQFRDPDTDQNGDLYPLRVSFCVKDAGAPAAYPSAARLLYYSSALSAGDGVKIEIATEHMRIWKAVATEVPRYTLPTS